MFDKNYKIFNLEVGGRNLTVEIGRFAEFANGSVFIKYGLTNVLVTATASHEPRDGIDFFPLNVDYEERLYSVGKIPGGFIKREGRPTEKAILTARLIDRPIRPLFPKDYRNDVNVVATVLSVDQDCSPEFASMIGASIALSISDIPFLDIVAGVNVGLIDNKFILNPSASQKEISDLNLTVASTKDKIMMIEAGANQISDQNMLEAILFAHDENKKIISFIEQIVSECGKEKHDYIKFDLPEDIYNIVRGFVSIEDMENLISTDSKLERGERLSKLITELEDRIKNENNIWAEDENFQKLIADSVYKFQKEVLRNMILNKGKRPDGRDLNQIRSLSAEVDVLSRTHGSAVFKRGQTQVLTVTTLGSMSDVQVLDGLEILEESKRYMHHYNFPSFSVGETRPSRGPGRREIGHGALAERALLPVIPSEDEFPYAIRLVSEVLSSNGSTSQASVCASSLSLMAAGVPIKNAVAGISIGLVTDSQEEKFVLLTDIQGLEDFCGDMDFKIAGTKKGITAIQLDIKIHGLTLKIIEQAFFKAHEARSYILDEVMNKCIAAPRKHISAYAPKIAKMKIDVEKLADVIGAKGRVIRKIIDESGVDKIDTEDDGRIFVVSNEQSKIDFAVNMIKSIIVEPKPGQIYSGIVTRITSFGAFVEFAFEKEGLVHISNLALKRVQNVEDVVKVGDKILVKIINIDEQGRINLSRKEALMEQNKKNQ